METKQAPTVKYHNPPESCQLCNGELALSRRPFFDAFLTNLGGPWGNVCETCARRFGVRLGKGKGQRYEWSDEHQAYIKTAG